jgi:hypothetical protein
MPPPSYCVRRVATPSVVVPLGTAGVVDIAGWEEVLAMPGLSIGSHESDDRKNGRIA